jgi:hypothetical protein
MSDFFNKQEPVIDENEEPEKVKLGDKEYTQDELNQLVGLGEQAKELEEKWNTPLESLRKGYTQTTQELANLRKKENEWLQGKIASNEPKAAPTDDEAQEAEARRLLKEKFRVVDRDDLPNEVQKLYRIERAAEKLNDRLSDLSEKIDGKDGRPKFNPNEVLAYMQQTNISNPESAYKLMHEPELDDWKTKQIQSVKKPGLTTIDSSTAGGKRPPTVPVTKDNLTSVLMEALGE